MRIELNPETGMQDHYDEEGELLYSTPFFKTPHNHDTTAEAIRTSTGGFEKTKTDQSFKEDADINVIMERVMKNGVSPNMIALPEHFGEDQRVDLFTARSRILESNRTFYNLPPKVREKYANDPGRWEQDVLRKLNAGDLDGLGEMGINTDEIHLIKPTVAPPGGTPGQGSTEGAPGGQGGTKPPGGGN